MTGSAVRIGRLRHRVAGGTPETRARLETAVAALDLRPPGLPPAAMLVVRSLDDPAPGRLRLDQPHGRLTREWERAVRGSLDRLIDDAARPADGAVSPDARAVLFRDRAELLGCYLDRGPGLGGAWWWRHVGIAPAHGRAEQALLAWPREVPGALVYLRSRGRLAGLLEKLPPAGAEAVVLALCAEHQLGALARAIRAGSIPAQLDRPAGSLGGRSAAAPASGAGASGSGADDAARVPPPPPAVLATVPGIDRLDPRVAVLAATALLLVDAPAIVAGGSFARMVGSWLSGERHASRHKVVPSERSDAAPRTGRRRMTPRSAGPCVAAARGDAAPRPVVRAPAPPGRPGRDDHPTRHPPGVAAEANPIPLPGGVPASEPAGPQERSGPAGRDEQTRLGGVFFLLNVALALQLYGDFTRPAAPRLGLHPFELVELLGRRLLGRADHDDDPVWALLGWLAGRVPDTPAGGRFRPAREWRLERSWLEAFATDHRSWRAAVDPRRLVVTHPAGFAVLDVPAPPAGARAGRRRELAPYRPHGRVLTDPIPIEPRRRRAAADWWLDHLVRYVSARLMRSPGLGDGERLTEILVRHDALVEATSSRLDVTFSLDRHPLALRIAGLDRDPGWVPAAGRDVRFHFS